jgi:hypothetical protein
VFGGVLISHGMVSRLTLCKKQSVCFAIAKQQTVHSSLKMFRFSFRHYFSEVKQQLSTETYIDKLKIMTDEKMQLNI